MPDAVALLIFLVTLTLVLVRPFRLPVAVAAVGGALCSIVLGRTDIQDLALVIGLTWNATLTLVGLLLLSTALQANGFFRWAALHVVGWTQGDGRALLLWLVGLTALVAAVLANDGAVLVMTPLAWALGQALGLAERARFACLFAVGFVSDAASTPLVVSNLTNILFADGFGLRFDRFAAGMALPTLLGLLAATGLLAALFWRDLPERFAEQPQAPAEAIADGRVFVANWLALGLLVLACFGGSALQLPVSLVVLPLGGVLVLVSLQRKLLTPRQVLAESPWGVLFFAGGLFVVVLALFRSGWLLPLETALAGWARTGNLIAVGGLVGALSAVVNNLPAALLTILSLKGAAVPDAALPGAVYASVLGTNVGCKVTPFGSLSTLLWLGLLRERGMTVSWGRYLLYSVPLTLIVLTIALAGLSWSYQLKL